MDIWSCYIVNCSGITLKGNLLATLKPQILEGKMKVVNTKVGPSLMVRDIITITPAIAALSRVSLDITGMFSEASSNSPRLLVWSKGTILGPGSFYANCGHYASLPDVWLPRTGLSLVTGAQYWPLIGREPILYLGSLQPVVRLLITSPGLIANVKTISRIFGNVQVSVRLDFYSPPVQLLSCEESIKGKLPLIKIEILISI